MYKRQDKTYKPGLIQARISNAKNHLVFPDAYASNAELYQYDVNAKVPATRDKMCIRDRYKHGDGFAETFFGIFFA